MKLFFLLFSVIISGTLYSQTTYKFIGNGNWSEAINWENNIMPPAVIIQGSSILIDPVSNGECVLNVPLIIPENVSFTIVAGKTFRIPESLNLLGDSVLTLNNNVHVVDSTKMILISSESMLVSGVYQYSFISPLSIFSIGDILLGNTSNGYIRRVSSFTITNNIISFQTTDGILTDVFKEGILSFSPGSGNQYSRDPDTYSFNFNNVVVYNNNGTIIKLNNGNVSINPDFDFDFYFQNSQLEYFNLGCKNSSFNANFDVDLTSSGSPVLINNTDTIKSWTKTFIRFIPVFGVPIPLVGVMRLDLIVNSSATADGNYHGTVHVNSTNQLNDVGINYQNNGWSVSNNLNSTFDLIQTENSGNINMQLNASIIPTFSFRLYNVLGPYLNFSLIDENVLRANTDLNWDFSSKLKLQSQIGLNAAGFSEIIPNQNYQWTSSIWELKKPDTINEISGNNQIGVSNSNLSEPIKVKVLNSLGEPQQYVRVYFNVIDGGGSVESQVVVTDNAGYAQTNWKLGSTIGIQNLEVLARKGDNSYLQNAPILFSALNDPFPTVATYSVSVSSNTAQVVGEVTRVGISPVTVRGICWDTTRNPTILNNVTLNGSGMGIFTGVINNLEEGRIYYARAYATNSAGTVYGEEKMFTMVAWYGSMQITSHQMTVDCCDTDNNGSPDCGTGGCQSASRIISGSFDLTTPIKFFRHQSSSSTPNFFVGRTYNSTTSYYSGYKVQIPTSGSFTAYINHFAPDLWGGAGVICNGQTMPSGNAFLQEINFVITNNTANSISGTWSANNIQVSLLHCKENCSGVWGVNKYPGPLFIQTNSIYPTNP